MENTRKCLRCGGEMKFNSKGYVDIRPGLMSPTDDWVYLELYFCPVCRHAEWVLPVTPLEEFERKQQEQENMTPVEKFEYTFRDYTEKQLQKVIDGRNYVDDAKKAAKNLLYRRKYGENM